MSELLSDSTFAMIVFNTCDNIVPKDACVTKSCRVCNNCADIGI